MSDSNPARNRLGIGAGLGMTVALHGVAMVILFTLIVVPDLGLYFISSVTILGLVQLVYMVPAILIARWRGQPSLAKGLIIGTVLTFLLNAACWAMFALPWIQN